ncbi:pleckstrin homology domain-containing family B member 1 [Rhinatrema bivittatum]|uniref:pleckstrin homology domain-containing family B member 1 n=1 Tax=Rhinatrema bivittatum TaxID=194408 RepID=UPI00112D407B|nr:pleckstrin homology domain-containing family B member 1 [Rhinatrema bivittatum]
MAIMKSGWLWRQSLFLRRWKKNWFDLWANGILVYYTDESRSTWKDQIVIRFNCINIKTGLECQGVQPPEGKSQECLLAIVLKDYSNLTLCAESEDDAIAWKLALLEANSNPVYLPDPYDPYQTGLRDMNRTMYASQGPFNTYYRAPRVRHVFVREYPHRMYRQHHPLGLFAAPLGLLVGALAFSTLGSCMWLPFWF